MSSNNLTSLGGGYFVDETTGYIYVMNEDGMLLCLAYDSDYTW